MFVLKIAAIALCVASLQFSPVRSLSDKERREIYREDKKRASSDGYYSYGRHKDDMLSFVLGDTYSRSIGLENILRSTWFKSAASKELLKALDSLRGYLLTKMDEGTCDLALYDQLLSIVRMSDKYFEGNSTSDRMIRMLVLRMHDAFTTKCVERLLADLRQLHESKYPRQLDSLAAFKAFLTSESLDLVQDRSYPDNSPSLMDKLKLVSNGDQAWSQFMKYAAVEVADNDPHRAAETEAMPRKERITAQFDFVVNNSCVPLSKSNVFISLVDEVPALAGKFVLDLFANDGLRHDFQKVERYVAMYKICMKLKDSDRNELMEKVEMHTRD